MTIKRVGSQPSAERAAEWFTGTVRIDPLFQAPDPVAIGVVTVTACQERVSEFWLKPPLRLMQVLYGVKH
jgi:hypothetical protein